VDHLALSIVVQTRVKKAAPIVCLHGLEGSDHIVEHVRLVTSPASVAAEKCVLVRNACQSDWTHLFRALGWSSIKANLTIGETIVSINSKPYDPVLFVKVITEAASGGQSIS